MKLTSVVVVLCLVTGCGSAADGEPVVDEVGADAAPAPGHDAGREGSAVAPGVDAGTPATDSAPEAATVPDATADAGLDVARAEATAPDAAASQEADAQALVEASKPEAAAVVDAAPEAQPVEAAAPDAGKRTTAEIIAATFPAPCGADGLRKCGGVIRDADRIVETWPLSCYHGGWILAGGFECSRGCGAAGVLCDP